jgi:hypothetical protein
MRKVRYSLAELYVISVLIYSGGGVCEVITYFKGEFGNLWSMLFA